MAGKPARRSAALDRGEAVVVEWSSGNCRFLNLTARILHSVEPRWRAMVLDEGLAVE
jgi:hypothetical protein